MFWIGRLSNACILNRSTELVLCVQWKDYFPRSEFMFIIQNNIFSMSYYIFSSDCEKKTEARGLSKLSPASSCLLLRYVLSHRQSFDVALGCPCWNSSDYQDNKHLPQIIFQKKDILEIQREMKLYVIK